MINKIVNLIGISLLVLYCTLTSGLVGFIFSFIVCLGLFINYLKLEKQNDKQI
jgi:hypothetical protein